MQEVFDAAARRAIRTALARESYASDTFRLVGGDLRGWDWLVATHRGLYAVRLGAAKLVAHGWFFGLRAHHDAFYLFENCALRDRTAMLGRVVRLDCTDRQITGHQVLAKGLHPNCHQLAIIGDTLCLLDTANQTVLRFRLDGTALPALTPFGTVSGSDDSAAYHHINAIAEIGGRIAVMLHNGKLLPERNSEIAWFDQAWQPAGRTALDGRMCHDLVCDSAGELWYCASLDGSIAALGGPKIPLVRDYMTRGLAFAGGGALADSVCAVGYSAFGPRQIRDGLKGGVILCDHAFAQIGKIELGGPPAEIIAIT
jgi:hypothetical protein